MNKNLKAHIALLLSQLIYGANYSISKLAMPQYIQPFAFIFLRVTGALGLFWITGIFVKEKMEKADFKKILVLSVFGVAINQMLFYKGLNMTTPINASIIMTSNPIVVLLLTAFILKEKISGNKIFGLILGITGALMLMLVNKNFTFGSDTIVGDILVFINSTSWAFYLILVKPLMKKYNSVTILKWVFLVGLFYITPFSITEFNQINWVTMPATIYWCIAFVVVGTTYFAFLFNTYALKELSPSVASIYIYMQPFLASLIAIAIGQDNLDPIKVSSGMLIIAGVFLVSKRSSIT
ncbi:MAG: EamA family transporter [Bacteroidetes bacterium]|nr:EamA family transporter [Bacteroidota bacterium]